MVTINELKKEIKDLRGADVRIFGQPTTLSDTLADTTIDVLDVLESLSDYVIDLDDYTTYNDDDECVNIFDGDENTDDIINMLEYHDYIRDVCDYKGDNTYNWCSPISNDIDFKVYNDVCYGGIFVELKIHRYGDVRGNYTDSIILHFDNDYEFYEVMSENDKYLDIEIEGKFYEVYVSIFNDSFEVYEDGSYITTVYGWDADEIKNEIVKKIA